MTRLEILLSGQSLRNIVVRVRRNGTRSLRNLGLVKALSINLGKRGSKMNGGFRHENKR